MPGPRKPHRKMAADGACAENAYPHGGGVLLGARRRKTSFHKLGLRRNHSCAGRLIRSCRGAPPTKTQ